MRHSRMLAHTPGLAVLRTLQRGTSTSIMFTALTPCLGILFLEVARARPRNTQTSHPCPRPDYAFQRSTLLAYNDA